MGGLIQSVGSGISGLVMGSVMFIGDTLRGIAAGLDRTLPGGMLALVVFVVLAVSAWQLAKR
jgi:hypothetical protein